jgi:dienelactone hydrolase
MNRVLFFSLVVLISSQISQAKVVVKEIDYKAGDTDMHGYLTYDDEASGKRPGVLVVHEWWGNNDYSKFRAQELAKLGYVAFALDMYGKGKLTDDPKQAGEWAGAVKKDQDTEISRLSAGLKILTDQPNVDSEKVGAIGYCFGGTMVLDMARNRLPVKAVVSFHGDPTTPRPANGAGYTTRILFCTGEADPFVPKEAVGKFDEEWKTVGAGSLVKITSYPNAQHSFTNPGADAHHLDGVKYNAEADKKSWQDMQAFFKDTLK